MTAYKIGVIGKGNVGGALARGLKRAGLEVRAVGSDKRSVHETAAWASHIVLAVPFDAIGDALKAMGDAVNGKTLVDATNALNADMAWAVGFTTSGAEELQKNAPKARVVKAFNTVFAQHMETGRLGDQPLTAFVAADEADAKQSVIEMARKIGFDAVDAGPLKNARLLEPMAYFNIQLGYMLKMGTDIGFKLLHAGAARSAEAGQAAAAR